MLLSGQVLGGRGADCGLLGTVSVRLGGQRWPRRLERGSLWRRQLQSSFAGNGNKQDDHGLDCLNPSLFLSQASHSPLDHFAFQLALSNTHQDWESTEESSPTPFLCTSPPFTLSPLPSSFRQISALIKSIFSLVFPCIRGTTHGWRK